ncbi:MAG: cytochrome BD ubiquinol oxidase subunit II [Bdellovibrio sp. ArHS]|uniref:cytochrome d ubiquinol oxidase subunit II n=1 Tax=Bdellovibrio sp. ArHS TaxID=1569284 RepID=UPI0005830B56|nr:cytochrome d ubiquinol oxidase subunit II [Bdellovibrio sp. ArHS]KHD87041.1 MAG: cytochrome BD ubiquinol oxidase subunit II [Bdellovibrio sp. ArHS]
MIEILLFFIGASLLLYVLFGGADYGAGILELLPAGNLREPQKKVINKAMGPVWEANHMWLILVVVILFMGFPSVFTLLMTSLHIPMVALLFGIVIRGCAFTFRHYDAIQEPSSQKAYTLLFGASSLWTSLWLGIIAGSLNRGLIDPLATDFHEAYIAPWWGLYPLCMGIFVVCIFSFLASIYLIGETENLDLKKLFIKRAFVLNYLVILSGAFVFAASADERTPLFAEFFKNKITLAIMLAATVLFAVLWFFIRKRKTHWARFVAAGQITLILLGWYVLNAPEALLTVQGPISFYEAAAPLATQWQLVLALLIGSLFIFPSLFYLMKVFKTGTTDEM